MNLSTVRPYRGLARLLPLLFVLTGFSALGQVKAPVKDTTKIKPATVVAAATVASANATYAPKIIPASPEAASLGKYVDIPVNNYTGTPSIDIPLYTIKTRDLAVPISISYHGSGVRVEEEASCVGLGWSLNSGGVIRHVVRGKDDFQDFDAGTKWRYLNDATTSGAIASKNAICYYFTTDTENAAWFFPNRTDGPTGGKVLDSKLQDMIATDGFFERPDIERDVFAFNFIGMSGKFLIEPLGGTQYKIHQLAQSDLVITLSTNALGVVDITGNSGFIITGTDGTKYTFGQLEMQRSRAGNPMVTAKTQNPNYQVSSWPETYNTFVGAWYLTRIESQRGDIINFTYTTTDWINALPGRSESYVTAVNGGASEENFRWNVTDVWTKQVYPGTITFDNGAVQFTGMSRTDLKPGAMRLSSLSVMATGGAVLKTVQFNQDYFSSGSSAPSHISKRLKLLSVQENNNGTCLPPHTFTYEESIPLPDKDSYMQDYWGYYNAKTGNDTKGTMLPPFAITGTISSSIYKLPASLQGGADRTVNPTAIRAGVLTKVSYPTGATAEFDFQPHVFANIATGPRPYFMVLDYATGNTQLGGGLRINKITAKDQSNVSEVTTYDYTASGTPTGKLMYNLQFSDFSAVSPTGGMFEMVFSSSPRHPMGSGAQGNPVGYSQVTAYKGNTPADAGYSIYQYRNSIDTRDVNFCIADASGTLADLTKCLTQPSSVFYNFYCDPYNIPQLNTYSSLTDATLPNYVTTLNGSLLHEEHWKGGTTPLVLKTVDNLYEAVNKIRIKNFKAVKRNNIASCLIYYTDSEWIRPTSTVVKEFGAGATGISPATAQVVTTTTYGYSSAGLHKQTASVTTINSKGEQFETLSAFPQDSVSGSASLADLKARNMVVRLRETRNKINADQSRTTMHITRTNYAKWFNTFMAPKTIESQIGTGPFVQNIAFSYALGDSYSSLGDVLSTTELSGIRTDYQYYTGNGKKYLPSTSTVPAGTPLARTTIYNYEPLKGISRMTDPNNLQTTYNYDPLGRLTTIKDPDQNVLKTYHYNYSTTGCNTTNTLISPNFKNILIIGNSITKLVAQSGTDGWQSTALTQAGGWGRAASAQSNDFAHILESRFKLVNPTAKVLPLWEAPFERDYVNSVQAGWTTYNYGTLTSKITNFFGTVKPDLVIIRLGENVVNSMVEPYNFKGALNTLINSVSAVGTKVILTNSMWPDQPLADAKILEVATERNLPFVSLSDMIYNPVYLGGNDPATLAKFPLDGGDRHPGDVGMLEIADRIWGKLFNETKPVTTIIPSCPSLVTTMLSPANNASIVGTASTSPTGYVTCPLAVTTCVPTGTTITNVAIWATLPDGSYPFFKGNALPDPSRPGVYTLSASQGSTNGLWSGGALDAGSYRFYAIVTTNNQTLTTSSNLVTLTAPVVNNVAIRARILTRPYSDPNYVSLVMSRYTGGTFYGTNDINSTTPTPLATIPATPALTPSTWFEYSFTNTQTYRYLIYKPGGSSYGELAELEFYSSSGKLDGAKLGSTNVYTATPPTTYTYTNAFDGNSATFWNGAAAGPGTNWVAIDLGNVSSSCPSLVAGIVTPSTNATLAGTTIAGNSGVTIPFTVTACAPTGKSIGEVAIIASTIDGTVIRKIGNAVAIGGSPGSYSLSSFTVANGVSGGWLPGTGGNFYTDISPLGQAGPLNANVAFKYWVRVKTTDGSTVVNSATITVTMTSTVVSGCTSLTASVLTPVSNASIVATASTTQPGSGKVTTALAVTTCAPAGSTISKVEIWAKTSTGGYPSLLGNALADASRPGVYTLSASEGSADGKWSGWPILPDSYRFYAVVITGSNSFTTNYNLSTLTAPVVNNVAIRARILTRPYSDPNYVSLVMSRYTGGTFYGTNDINSTTPTPLATIPATPALTPSTWFEYSFTNTQTYRYLIYKPGGSSYGELAELEFYSSSGKLDGAKLGSTNVYTATPPTTYTYTNAFDGNSATFWNGAAAGPGTNWVAIDLGNVSSSCPSLVAGIVTPSTNATLAGTTIAGNSGVTIPFTVTACAPTGKSIGEVAIIASTIDGTVIRKIGNAVAIGGSPGSYSLSSFTVANGVSGGWLPGTGGNFYTDISPLGQAGPLNANVAFKYWVRVKTTDGSTVVNSATITVTMTSTVVSGCTSLTASVLTPVSNASIVATASTTQPGSGKVTTALAVTTCAPAGSTISKVEIWAKTSTGGYPSLLGNALADASRPGVYTLSASEGSADGKWSGWPILPDSYRFYAVVITGSNSFTTNYNLSTLTAPVVNNVAIRARILTRPYSDPNYVSLVMSRYTGGTFYGTNDINSTTPTPLATIPATPALTPSTWFEYSFTNTQTYRYLIYKPGGSSYGELAELEFYSSSGKLDGAKLGSTNVYTATPPTTYTYTNAFDGNSATFWNGAAAGPGTNWVAIDLGSVNCTTPAAPVITTSAILLCSGQSATLTATGCSGTVTWSTGQTGLTSLVSPTSNTNYTATCTVNGCVSTASNQLTISVPTVMPTTWTTGAIGIPPIPGCANRAQSGSLTVRGVGNVPGTAADAFPYVYKTLSGDVTIIAKIAGIPTLTTLGDGPRVGIIVRNSASTNASFVWLVQEANGVIGNYRRSVDGGAASFGPTYAQGLVGGQLGQAWIKLVKVGSVIRSYYSMNANPEANNTWTLLNTHTDLSFGSSFLVGFTAFNYNYGVTGAVNNTTVAEGVFTNITVNGVSF